MSASCTEHPAWIGAIIEWTGLIGTTSPGGYRVPFNQTCSGGELYLRSSRDIDVVSEFMAASSAAISSALRRSAARNDASESRILRQFKISLNYWFYLIK